MELHLRISKGMAIFGAIVLAVIVAIVAVSCAASSPPAQHCHNVLEPNPDGAGNLVSTGQVQCT